MNELHVIVVVLLVAYVVLDTYTFRFQRVTLGLSREHSGQGDKTFQIVLTPSWMGALGWLRMIVLAVTLVLVFKLFGWLWVLVILSYSFVGAAFTDSVSPLPSHSHCFDIIERHLENELRRMSQSLEPDTLALLVRMKVLVAGSRKKHQV